MARPKKRKREIESTRRHIIDAAARVFAAKGFAGASMQAIATEAGYSPPSLYSYFDGKQAILDALLKQLHKDAEDLFEIAYPSGLSFRQKLELLLMKHVNTVEKNHEAYVFFNRHEGMTEAAEAGDIVSPIPYIKRITDWLAEVAQPEDLGGRPAEEAAYLLWGVQHALFTRWLAEETPGSAAKLASEIVVFFMGGLAAVASQESES